MTVSRMVHMVENWPKPTENAPVIRIETTLQQQKIGAILRIAIVDSPKNEDREQAAETANDNLKTTPPVTLVVQTNDQYRYRTSADKVGDEVDLQNTWAFQCHNDGRKDDQHNGQSNPPKVKLVAKDVVAAS